MPLPSRVKRVSHGEGIVVVDVGVVFVVVAAAAAVWLFACLVICCCVVL